MGVWWDSLDGDGKLNVGEAAIHYHKMSANYKWCCGRFHGMGKDTDYLDLKKSQRKIIEWIFKEKDKPFQRFYLAGMLGL